jgi:hypothetical protein
MAEFKSCVIKGDFRIKRKVNGIYLPKLDLGATKFSMSLKNKDYETTGKGRDNFLQPTSYKSFPTGVEVEIDFSNISPKTIAIALMGNDVAFSQASGTASDEVAVANKGGYVNLAFRNIAATGLSVKNTAGAVTYVKDTDYTIDYSSGQLFVTETSAITDNQSLKVSYTYNAVTAKKTLAATSGSLVGEAELIGVNAMDDSEIEIFMPEISIATDGAIDWLSDKPIEIKMKGKLIVPPGRKAPFEVLTGIINI